MVFQGKNIRGQNLTQRYRVESLQLLDRKSLLNSLLMFSHYSVPSIYKFHAHLKMVGR